ncbi:MAG: hypothetical protein HUU50_02780 [Candidatus Brocadiae bacterium]|nr:hypothetical protein [Candidatus Brocadiia bacterium]
MNKLILPILMLIPFLYADPWYTKIPIKTADYFNIGPFHSVASGNERIMGSFYLKGDPSSLRMYVIMGSREAKKIQTSKMYLYHEVVLDMKSADFWKGFFYRHSESHNVPFVYSIIGLVFSEFSYAMLLMDAISALEHKNAITHSALAELMAPGGVFAQYLTILYDQEQHPYLHSNLFYQVKVQNKLRYYLIYSSIFALKISD